MENRHKATDTKRVKNYRNMIGIETVSEFFQYYDANVLHLIDKYVKSIDLTFSRDVHNSYLSFVTNDLIGDEVINFSDSSGNVFSIRNNEYITIISSYNGMTNLCTFSHDKNTVATFPRNFAIKLWDTRTGKCFGYFRGHEDIIQNCSFSHNDKLIVTCSRDMTVRIWNIETGKCDKIFKIDVLSRRCIFSPDDTMIASCSNDRSGNHFINVWDVNTGRSISSFREQNYIDDFVFLPNGRSILSWSLNVMKAWDVHTGKCYMTYEGHSGRIWSCDISSNRNQIVSCSSDNTIKLWDIETGRCIGSFKDEESIHLCTFSHSGDMIVSLHDSSINVWSVDTGKCLFSFSSDTWSVSECLFSKDGKVLFILRNDGSVSAIDVDHHINIGEGRNLSIEISHTD